MKDIKELLIEGTANPKGSLFIKNNHLLELRDFIQEVLQENGDKGIVIQKKGRNIEIWQADPHGYIETNKALSFKNAD